MSCVIFSQNTRKRQEKIKVSKPVLTLIKKDLDYCNSLKIAYAEKSKELKNITQRNKLLFRQLSAENDKISRLQSQIEKQQKELLKINKKSDKCLLYGIVGTISGIIIGVIVAK